MSSAEIQQLETILSSAHNALDKLAAAGLTPSNAEAGVAMVRTVERLGTRIDALQTSLYRTITDSGVHRTDAFTPKTFIRHYANTSDREAATRQRTSRALTDLTGFAAAYEAGELSTDTVRRVAQAYTNRRVRAALIEGEADILQHALDADYRTFDQFLSQWTRLADEDGTCERNQRSHESRNARLHQDFDLSFSLDGNFAALQGSEIDTVFKAFIDIEFRVDWDIAKTEHGDATNQAHLGRTDSQRRADALHKIFLAANVNGSGKPITINNVVIDQETFQRWTRKHAGVEVEPDDPSRPSYRCSTIDGDPLEPGEVVANALNGELRRVLVDSKSVVIDLGRKTRLFTGNARLAAQIPDQACTWVGCHVRMSACQIDHSHPWNPADGGPGGCTCPENAAGMCGRHNRHKQHGYQTHRGPDGNWVIIRPDGTQLE